MTPVGHYTYLRYEDGEKMWLSVDKELPMNTLCWVLQTKGKKTDRRRIEKSNSSITLSQTTDFNDEDTLEAVDHRRKALFSRAWVEAQSSTEDRRQHYKNDNNSNSPRKKRVLVRYPKGSRYHVKRENLLPVLQISSTVIILPETHIYRRWALVHTRPDDWFCEIGCDAGILVQRIWEQSTYGQFVSGIDKSEQSIQKAKKRYPSCMFLQWEVPLEKEQEQLDTKSKLNDNMKKATSKTPNNIDNKVGKSSSVSLLPTNLFPAMPFFEDINEKNSDNYSNNHSRMNMSLVVAIDINGNRELQAVQKCIQIVCQEWKPRLVIVKSRALYAEIGQSRTS